MTVGELTARLPEHELSEWMAYYQLEPFGEERADLRAGIVAWAIATTNGGKKGKGFKPEDFMPQFDRAATRKPTAGATLANPESVAEKAEAFFGSRVKDE